MNEQLIGETASFRCYDCSRSETRLVPPRPAWRGATTAKGRTWRAGRVFREAGWLIVDSGKTCICPECQRRKREHPPALNPELAKASAEAWARLRPQKQEAENHG